MPSAGLDSQLLGHNRQMQQSQRQYTDTSHPLPPEQPHLNRPGYQQPLQPNLQHHQQQQATIAQLLGIEGPKGDAAASLAQQHASVLTDARTSVSAFADALQEAKLSCPGDRADIRALVVALERASKALSSELSQSVVKLRSLHGLVSIDNAAQPRAFGTDGRHPNGLSHPDMFNSVSAFGLSNQSQQSAQGSSQQSFPFDLVHPFQPQTQNNPMFEFSNSNANSINGLNGHFGSVMGGQQPGSHPQGLSPAVAQYLAQTPDANRPGTFDLVQSVANVIGAGGGPEAIQSSPHPFQTLLSQHRASLGMDVHHSPNVVPPPLPMTNAAALEALTSLGVTPAMLEALGLGSLVNQVKPQNLQSGSQDAHKSSASARTSDSVDEQRNSDGSNEETSRKKRKLTRGKQRDDSASQNSFVAPNGRSTLSASHASSSKSSHILGVGLRQEGDRRFRNRKLLRDLREHLYRWLGTNEFRKLKSTYRVAEWVPNPNLSAEDKRILASLPPGGVAQPPIATHIFHVDFTSRDFYRTNQSLIDAIVAEASKKVEAKPEGYGIVPGTIDRDHLEDVAKDLMDSARSGFRMSLRTGLQAEKEDKEKHEKYRGMERAKTKCRNREIGALRLRHAIPRQMLIPGAYSDDAASDEDLHGLTKSEWKRQRLRKLRIAKGWEAVTPKWRNKHLTRAYHKADIVSKSKQMARWRRDEPVDLPVPIRLYGKTLPKQIFDPDWLAQHRGELEDEPYCIKINDAELEGWDEQHHPLGEDTSDEMEWSDAKDNEPSKRSTLRIARAESSTRSPVASAASAMDLGPGTRIGSHKRTAVSEPKQEESAEAVAPTADRASAPAVTQATDLAANDIGEQPKEAPLDASADVIPSAASMSSIESNSSNSGKSSSSSSSGDSNSGSSTVAPQGAVEPAEPEEDEFTSEAGSEMSIDATKTADMPATPTHKLTST